MKDIYWFWAICSRDEDGISVRFPELPGCYTGGSDPETANQNAKEALGLHIYGMEQDGEQIPEPFGLESLLKTLSENEYVSYVEVRMIPFRSMMRNKAVKKTLTIPQWLNDMAEEHNVNFSQVLQDALKQTLGVVDPSKAKE
ncbi:type II toxin-antitoxin system HicB family antitoxin [Tumebacillus sp. DT12]|uniref:Type II toxin-antitoxin system HicB family antitoxin n=1 Tax=Tumebacillus lacus TaxID=2995335 RepID=A0ABT3WWX8_9BACL|nr:type II toxin-antitoxin system HicB family antitoxin [Tumebacillus lacus]MCX7568721.1 type II toxin-antitoxin system HicB family antitoxin [Tumebacillus lacus]